MFARTHADEMHPEEGTRAFVRAAIDGGASRRTAEVYGRYHRMLSAGRCPHIREASLEPAEPEALDVERSADARLIDQAVMIKLNGGLGTTMGLQGPKSLIPVKGEHSFLDITVRHARHHRIPLVLMNSFATRWGTRAALEGMSAGDVRGFVQHRLPKVDRRTLRPVRWDRAPHLAWAPPGHGDLFLALAASGILDALLAEGRRYAFVSNIDNLGATFDPRILDAFAAGGWPLLMEVTRRTAMDQKGGHLAFDVRRGGLVLRESAQCAPEDRWAFGDIERHRYFNTNNIWLDLRQVRAALEARDGFLGLPLIRNAKTVDPRDATSTPVYQIETAIGSAIAVFEGAGAVAVPRTRFLPVKSCADLLVMRSDATEVTDEWRLKRSARRSMPGLPRVRLDQRFFGRLDLLEARCGGRLPSLLDCRSLEVDGDVLLSPRLELRGDVHLSGRA